MKRTIIATLIFAGLVGMASAQTVETPNSETLKSEATWEQHRSNMEALIKNETFDEESARKLLRESEDWRLNHLKERHDRYQNGDKSAFDGRHKFRKHKKGGHRRDAHHGYNYDEMPCNIKEGKQSPKKDN